MVQTDPSNGGVYVDLQSSQDLEVYTMVPVYQPRDNPSKNLLVDQHAGSDLQIHCFDNLLAS